ENSVRVYLGEIINEQWLNLKQPGPHNPNAIEEQIRVTENIKKVTTGHSRRPLVLTSDRGRGKSSAMGIAAAEIISQSAKKVAVVAPSINNLNSFFFHAERKLRTSNSLAKKFKTRLVSKSGGEVKFITASNLAQNDSQQKREFDTVMIDEAAAIPVSLLDQINQKFNRIVYATTCHGYEGNGQGFEIRFKQKLVSLRPQTRFETLIEPFRWALGDPLEKALSSTFLFDKDIETLNLSTPLKTISTDKSICQFKVYSKQRLKQNGQLLGSIFSLLVNAHYQTRPADLQNILLNTNMSICGLEIEDQLIAVALLNNEGDLNPDEICNIYNRKNQSNAHLLPQSLIANYGIQQSGTLRFLRVMRIAVHPELKRQGIGSRLLYEISNEYAEKVDIVGTSFAASQDVVSFWCKNEFAPVRIGSAKDSSTGELSIEFLMPLNRRGKNLVDQITRRFSSVFQFNFPAYSRFLHISSLRKIFLRTPVLKEMLSEDERSELRQFSKGQRALNVVGDLLTRWILADKQTIDGQLASKEFEVLLFTCLSRLPPSQLAEELNLSGKKQVLIQLREICEKALDANTSQ
ncbi:MAG: GNAT family N-acetyltransferase, partial [Kangiellaceae bacterium]|nr:GNAT family N-acetyltransferase [Kangiellaceae bacterium]